MKVLGSTELAAFLKQYPERAEPLRAWAAEIRNRAWGSADAMAADFRVVQKQRPEMIFRVGDPPTAISTLVDFRNQVLLVTSFEAAPTIAPAPSRNMPADHD